MNIVQNLTFPNLDITAQEDLYVRKGLDCIISKCEKKLFFTQPGSQCSFDTFYNSFSVKTWHDATSIENVKLYLKGKGKFVFRLILNKLDGASRFLFDSIIKLDDGIVLELGQLSQLKSGMLFFQLELVSDEGELTEGYYFTNDEPNNPNVKLGIVITHFNRKNYVLPAIKRVSLQLLENSFYKEKLSLIVVDNSSNITNEEAYNAIVIPNENLGGSGGFTRGLLYLKDHEYTHCLFMDDDASCEIESIKRTYALLQFSKNDKTAVSGALISEKNTNILIEKGAVLSNNGIQPRYMGLCLSNVNDLLLSDNDPFLKRPNYGAWWFFAFKISDVEKYPFPFFVRGDDILFGVLNKFNIVTMNGIACWGEEFSTKESPMTRYLGVRGELVARLLSDNLTLKDMLITFTRRYFSALFSYNYGSAKAIIVSINDILEGPDTFLNDLNSTSARNKISKLQEQEKFIPLNISELDIEMPVYATNKINRILRAITINGLIFPSFMMKNKIVFQNKGFRAVFREIFRYKKVLYWSSEYEMGYVSNHNKKEIMLGISAYVKSILRVISLYKEMNDKFLEKKDFLTSEAFWRSVYNQTKE